MNQLETIPDLIDRVFKLQETYNESVTHSANKECMEILERLVDRWLSLSGSSFSGESGEKYDAHGDFSRGASKFPIIPWARLTDPSKSRSAKRGFYLVLLFSAGGKDCFLSVNQGSDGDDIKGGTKVINQRVQRTREFIEIKPPQCLQIDLNSTTRRATNYKNGHITGFEIKRNLIPDESTFIEMTQTLLHSLGNIYDNEVLIDSANTETENPMNDHPDPDNSTPLVELAQGLNWTIEKTEELVASLDSTKKQVILGGPPGTGKTFAAEKIAHFLVGSPEYVEIVQFHPSYGYEDFVEGLRPVPLPNGGFEFKRTPGVVPRISALIDGDDEVEGDDHARVLIIDEINRANIARVFGELMYLLEYRNKSIRLMLEDKKFSLPSNLIIIGTMNTADRSTRSLDIAMRRRFNFFELLPDVEILKKFYNSDDHTNELGQELFDGFESLNNKLRSDLDKHFMVGHSYFMENHMDAKNIKTIWRQEVFPLIEEYFFDNDDRTAEYSINSFWPSV